MSSNTLNATSRPPTRIFWLDVVVFLGMLVMGAAKLPLPFGGDQALNLLMGQVIYQGGAPYRDLWDLKHPGVFLFFAGGGALFGFDELGIHLFELLWMLALALVIRVVATRWLQSRTSAALAPVLTVGLYYAIAGPFHLTQTEAVIGFPLLVCLWCAAEALAAERRMNLWLVASGVAAGVVMVFKIPYVALPAVFWLLAVRALESRRGASLRQAVVSIAPWVSLGALLPIFATVTFLVVRGVADLAFWTFFSHPAEVIEVVSVQPRRLLYAARFWVIGSAPVLVLASVGVWGALRRRMDLMSAGLCAWLFIGLALIGMQMISWWEYHFLLLLVPVGMLGALGVETAATRLAFWLTPRLKRASHILAASLLLLFFAPHLTAIARTTADMWRRRPLPLSHEGIGAYHAEHYRGYAAIRERTAFLRDPGSYPGPIYVIDTPVYYLHSGRNPAISLLAPWFHPTDLLWQRLIAELRKALPPYVRVSDSGLQAIVDYRPSLSDEVAGLVTFIKRDYVPLDRDEDGIWYMRRDLAARR